ncbi:MAG: hypothetical protein PVJ09_03985 [Candidatus Woesebacteria bacterium]|jgi:VIT1/CCC1 family predicted Fe2+/Mn2+ transporter
MKNSVKTGFSFGLTSGIITTLGLITGLISGDASNNVIIAGILTIAIADSMSDALGIHIAEEIKKKKHKEIWLATITTLFFKFIFALSFVWPFIFFSLKTAFMLDLSWGITLLTIFSFMMAKQQKKAAWKAVTEHLLIALIVIFLSKIAGNWIKNKLT